MNKALKSRKKTAALLAIAVAGATIAATPTAVGASATTSASTSTATSVSAAVTGLTGPRGVAMGPRGKLVVAESDGTFSRVVRRGPNAGDVVRIGRVPKGFLAPAIDINNRGQIFVLTPEGENAGAATLYRYTPGRGREKIANIHRYQRSDPDPYNLAEPAGQSNPFGVAALNDGSALVADAANNDLLRVWPNGEIVTVARVRPRTVLSPDLGPEGPPAGTRMPSEAVITSVTVGADGAYYIGELRGFPATPGKSQIWRIKPGSTDAVCNPRKPRRGDCKRYVDGLTSIVDLGAGRGGSIYAVELSKASWLAAEAEPPVAGAEIGSLIRISKDRMVRQELAAGRLVLPGGVEVGRGGGVFATTPVFGPGRLLRVR